MPKDTVQINLNKYRSICPEHNILLKHLSFCILKRSMGIRSNRVEKLINSHPPSSFEVH